MARKYSKYTPEEKEARRAEKAARAAQAAQMPPDEKERKKELRRYMLAARRKGVPVEEYVKYRKENPIEHRGRHGVKRATRKVRVDRYAKWTPKEFLDSGEYVKIPWEKMKAANNPNATDEKKKEWIYGRRNDKRKDVLKERYETWSPQDFLAHGKRIPWRRMEHAGNPFAADKKAYQKAKRMDARRIARRNGE